MLKLSLILALACTSVLAYDGPTIVSQDQNIYRSYGNLGQVSTYSKSLTSPYTSVQKSDVRVTNPGLIAHPTYTHIGYPSAQIGYPGAQIGYPGLATTVHHQALPAFSHPGYLRPAPLGTYQNQIPTGGYITQGKTIVPGNGAGLLGVAYSAAPTVSHMSFSNGLGLTYEW